MSRKCIVTGAAAQFGNNVSHSNRKTRRRFNTNIKKMSVWSDALKRNVTLTLNAHGIRTLEHNGGLDAFLLSTPPSRLTDEARKVRTLVKKAKAA